jgi:hypothetical protein
MRSPSRVYRLPGPQRSRRCTAFDSGVWYRDSTMPPAGKRLGKRFGAAHLGTNEAGFPCELVANFREPRPTDRGSRRPLADTPTQRALATKHTKVIIT